MDKTEFLKSVSDYLQNQTRDGVLICYKHGVEHTGKNAYTIILDSEIYKKTGEELYFNRAKARAMRTLERLEKHPAGFWTFAPGASDPQNCCNDIVDCGSVVDSLSSFLSDFSDKLKKKEEDAISDAIFKVCDSYLKKTVPVRYFPNQALWGGTGLASAYKIFREKTWKEALLEYMEKYFTIQRADGSIPYLPDAEKHGTHLGDSDITSYYHSRHISFAYHILDLLGERKWDKELQKGVDFLVGITHPDGIKEIRVEAKRWYWESDYEVASNSFDIPCLVRAYEQTKDDLYLRYASLSLNQLMMHVLKDGGVTSHFGKQNNYQCRIFWNCRVAWTARYLDKVPLEPPELKGEYLKLFDDAGVVKFENEKYCSILRGKKKPFNISFGTPAAGGNVIYYGTAKKGWKNEVKIPEWDVAEQSVTLYRGLKPLSNTRAFFKENGKDVRRRMYKTLVELRAGNVLFAKTYPFRHILVKYLDELVDTYSTQWDLDSEPKLVGKKLTFTVNPSKRNGEKLGTTVKIAYEFKKDGLKRIS